MPDSDTNIDIVIRTQADLAGAKAAEEQLARDIAKAKELGQSYHVSEIQLMSLREEVMKQMGTNVPPIPTNVVEKPWPRMAPEAEGVLPGVILRLMQSSLRAAQQALGFSSGQKPAEPDRKPGQEKTNAAPTSVPANGLGIPATNAPAIDGAGKANLLPQTNGPTLLPGPPVTFNPFAPGNDAGAGDGAGSNASDRLAGSLTGQTQVLQSAGERLRAAMEQNAAITNALFLRTLDLVDGQNRKLGDVDRRIAELSNQIKSLKNT